MSRSRTMSFHPSEGSKTFRGMDLDEKLVLSVSNQLSEPKDTVRRSIFDDVYKAIYKRMELIFKNILVPSPEYKKICDQYKVPVGIGAALNPISSSSSITTTTTLSDSTLPTSHSFF